MAQLDRRQFLKVSALMGAAALSAGLFAGCGSSQGESSVSSAHSAASEELSSASASSAVATAVSSGKGEKIAVVFFSQTGNTAGIASHIANHLQVEAIELKAAEPYTSADLDYNDSSTRATVEQNAPETRPALAEIPDLEGYDTVFLGYPIWWGKAPRVMCTFVENCDLSGKTVVPFCTSGSSDIDQSADELADLTSLNTVWLVGKRFAAGADGQVVAQWVDSLAL